MNNLLVIGHSHIGALHRGYLSLQEDGASLPDRHIISLRSEAFLLPSDNERERSKNKVLASKIEGVNRDAVLEAIKCSSADAAIVCLNGNEHNIFGLFRDTSITHDEKYERLIAGVRATLSAWMRFLLPHLPACSVLLLPPPPIESIERIREYPGKNKTRFIGVEIEGSEFRLELWRRQCSVIRTVAAQFGISVMELPEAVFCERGFLAEKFWGNDPTHGNPEYGKFLLPMIVEFLENTISKNQAIAVESGKSNHPYSSLPDYCFWKESVAKLEPNEVDPVTDILFKIRPRDKVATAGSCFAQHISKRLKEGGYNYYIAETAPEVDEDGHGIGSYNFSARYGNIYTARQLLQLFERAFGYFSPVEKVWLKQDGGYCDPFRPQIHKNGFENEESLLKDARRHLAAVRRMFLNLDVFVFTLGLTECWMSRLDGAAYPIAPGVVGGEYDPGKHVFVNFEMADVKRDLNTFLLKLGLVNPKARVILTVSPVPLVATAEHRHVLLSTTYSKAVLRVAAEEIVRSHDNVYYFPSYEIITGQHIGNAYYEDDKRSVSARGVDHVMRIFMEHMTETMPRKRGPDTASVVEKLAKAEAMIDAACDEEMLAR